MPARTSANLAVTATHANALTSFGRTLGSRRIDSKARGWTSSRANGDRGDPEPVGFLAATMDTRGKLHEARARRTERFSGMRVAVSKRCARGGRFGHVESSERREECEHARAAGGSRQGRP
jgi:hypothetical protein